MAEEAHEIVEGDGYAVGHIDAMGEPYGFRKIRKALGVEALGINAIVLPPGYETGSHLHEIQEETYFVHQGRIRMTFNHGEDHVLGPGGVARVDPATVRKVANVGEGDAVYIVVGGNDGYVGRDGKLPKGETSPFGSGGDAGPGG